MIPGPGFIFDCVNAAWYYAEDKPFEAAMSAAAAIPGLGEYATSSKLLGKGGKALELFGKGGGKLRPAFAGIGELADDFALELVPVLTKEQSAAIKGLIKAIKEKNNVPENELDSETNARIGRPTGKVKSNFGNEYDLTPYDNHYDVYKNPGPRGEPNTSVDIHDSEGNFVTRRWYDSDGRAVRDIDMTQHKNPKQHPEFPHEHIWDWSKGFPPKRI